ncbi:hypothetical protein H5410_003637, partial [Solanum commersonii]
MDFSLLQCIPKMITEEENNEIKRMPTKEEVNLYCWEIIEDEVWKMVRDFFSRFELPRYITHTNL